MKMQYWMMAGLLLAAPVVMAQEDFDSEALIKYREGVMKAQAGHMSALAQLVRGKVKDDGTRLAMHTRGLNEVIQDLPSLFPEGSDFGETEAKDAVWENWDEFVEKSRDAEQAVGALVRATEGSDKAALVQAFKDVSDACKGCHKKFREEEEE